MPAAPGVVLCVADGIVRIVVHVVAALPGLRRLPRGIDPLIGVAAGERERRDREDDAEPRGRPQFIGAGQWDVRLVDAQEKFIRFSYSSAASPASVRSAWCLGITGRKGAIGNASRRRGDLGRRSDA